MRATMFPELKNGKYAVVMLVWQRSNRSEYSGWQKNILSYYDSYMEAWKFANIFEKQLYETKPEIWGKVRFYVVETQFAIGEDTIINKEYN